jgi:uncharacterized protein (DUF433 family)
MEPQNTTPLGPKGLRLLRLLVDKINAGEIRQGQPKTFVAYSEALRSLNIPARGRAGQQLQREGLTELNEWTKSNADVPKIAGLIVNKSSRRPSEGYPESHGFQSKDWTKWWLAETTRAIEFDWSPFLTAQPAVQQSHQSGAPRVREDEGAEDYRALITMEPGKRGGRPCIRGMRITVGDILGWMAAGMSEAEILDDFPELTSADIRAALAFSRDRDEHTVVLAPLAG